MDTPEVEPPEVGSEESKPVGKWWYDKPKVAKEERYRAGEWWLGAIGGGVGALLPGYICSLSSGTIPASSVFMAAIVGGLMSGSVGGYISRKMGRIATLLMGGVFGIPGSSIYLVYWALTDPRNWE